MAWSSTADAITALRADLSDGPTDKLATQKKLFGSVDGTNKVFKSVEGRLITDFTSASAPFGLYIDNVRQANAAISAHDTDAGVVTFVTAPTAGNHKLEGTYYYRWFLDSELDLFLKEASNWLGLNDTYQNIPGGLIPACLGYAQKAAFRKLGTRLMLRASTGFLAEDAPKKEMLESVDVFNRLASQLGKDADKLRDDFYKRQGQANAPLFGNALGGVTDPTPQR